MKYNPGDFIDADDIAIAKSRAPRARQLCTGSMQQLMVDAGLAVSCPVCGKHFTSFETQRNRAQVHPIVPSHLPDKEGQARIELDHARRRASDTPRPY